MLCSAGYRPWDKGGAGHPDPYSKGGGVGLPKTFFVSSLVQK